MHGSICNAEIWTLFPLYMEFPSFAEKLIETESPVVSRTLTVCTELPLSENRKAPLDDCWASVPARIKILPLMFGIWPNISGAANFRHGNIEASAGIITNAYGSLEWNASVSSEVSTFTHSASVSYPADRLDFQAELSNASYQGNKLQPAALQTLACIRV